jgi:hypothetical protein
MIKIVYFYCCIWRLVLTGSPPDCEEWRLGSAQIVRYLKKRGDDCNDRRKECEITRQWKSINA